MEQSNNDAIDEAGEEQAEEEEDTKDKQYQSRGNS